MKYDESIIQCFCSFVVSRCFKRGSGPNCSKPSTHSHSIVKELFSDFETCMLHKLGHLHSFELHLGHSSVLVHL